MQNPEREDLSVTFELSPFITGWPSAEERFITAINREFSELLPVRPQDFSSSRAGELGESYCKYRIFGGRSTIVLNPDTLQLNFVEFIEIDNEIVIEIIRRSLDMLSKDIGGYTRNHFYLVSDRHVAIVNDGRAEVYLNQFALEQPADIAGKEETVEYQPSVKIVLSDKDRHWTLRRTVEKSELLDNGLFVSTHISVSSHEVTAFETQKELVERIYDLADQSVGLKYH